MQGNGDSDLKRERDLAKIASELVQSDLSFEESQNLYTKWANAGSFDYMLCSRREIYAGPHIVMDKCVQFITDRNQALLLDLCSGPGIIAEMLLEQGFKNIHGLDSCKAFNEISRRKGIYKKLLEQCIGMGSVVAANDDIYDAVVCNGAFGPGHVPCDALHEIVRIIKPGGYFINTIREEFLTIIPEYKDRLKPLMDLLVEEGKWKKIVWENYDNHFKEKQGVVMIFQIC